MADRFGARNVFRIAIAMFTLASVLCGSAQTLAQLVAFRVLQGAGGAMMVPVGRLLLLRNVPKSELVAAMAWLTTPALIGPVVGPPLGGFITTYFSWRWVFDINIPIASPASFWLPCSSATCASPTTPVRLGRLSPSPPSPCPV